MFEQRLKSIKEKLIKENLDAVFVSSVSNIVHLTGCFNFSEIEREAYLLIGKNFQYIITDGRYSENIKKHVSHFELFERGYKQSTEVLFKKLEGKIGILGIEEDNLTISEYKLIKKYFKTKNFEGGSLRSIKNNEEIKTIEKACNIGDLAFRYILKKIKLGISEKTLSWELEKFIKGKGYENSFSSIVAFDKNSSIPHHNTGKEVLNKKDGQFILLDFGVKVEGFCSDMTRTIFFGKPSDEQTKIYKTVLEAQEKTVGFMNSLLKQNKKIRADKVDKITRDYILSKGYESIPHSLGHGIGLQVHEHPFISPKSEEILKEGMVFSIEPGIYIPNFGGVRIEDLYVIEKNGLRQLTTSSSRLINI